MYHISLSGERQPELKYLIIKPALYSREAAVLFDERLVHAQMAGEDTIIVSAGFCSLSYDDRSDMALIVEVWGKSESLNVKYRDVDKNLIYQSIIPGAYDYFMEPDDPMFNQINDMIQKQIKENDETF